MPPTDKPLPLPSRVSEIPSCIAAGNDLQQFLDAQVYTLCYQLTALVYMYYGRTDNLNDAPLVFRCLIAPVKRQSLTPANSWFIRTFWVSSLKTECEINPNFVQVWEEQQHTFSMSEKRGKEMLGPSYGGMVTVIFHVEDSDFKVLSHIPFMALRQPQALGNPRIRSAVEDAGQLCGLYTNHGIPIWPLFDPLFKDPMPIELVRKGRKWKSVALQDFYGAAAIGRRSHSWQTKYLPFQLIAILHALSVEQYVLELFLTSALIGLMIVPRDVMLRLQEVTRKMVNDIAAATGRRLVVPWS